MRNPASAYATTAKQTLSSRELEAQALVNAAAKLQAVKDGFAQRRLELDEALTFNRKLWTVLVSSATAAESPLPVAIKQNIANLSLFIFKQTFAVMAEPAPEKLAVLITINREIAAGLRTQPPTAHAA